MFVFWGVGADVGRGVLWLFVGVGDVGGGGAVCVG